ncbi:1-phosphatidylinositol 4,5-bisphosphate phosphodiesterase eta-1 [Diretmus argenteus]
MKQTFEEADKNGDGLLNIDEIYQLLHKLNVNLPRRKVKQMFQEADTDDQQGTLTYGEFSVFYKMMSLRRDLFLLMMAYSDRKDHLTAEELANFLRNEQKMANVTPEYCADIIAKFEVADENKERGGMGIEGFTSFMRSPTCDIFNPLHNEVNQDMEQPLCNYFVASSHNTYLTGDQLLSHSKTDMYAWVLQSGCRCVEVDCWDGPDGEPMVQHGYTLTSKIPFKSVIETINKYAFINNPYPVIMSIENHCSIQQQKKIAQYLREILGDKLDLGDTLSRDSRTLPSPHNLQGKILIKGKRLPAYLSADVEEGEVSDDDSADEIEDDYKLKNSNSNGHHQVEYHIRRKLDSLLKESQIGDKEDTDSFSIRALLRATHQGIQKNLRQSSNGVLKKSQSRSFITTLKQKRHSKSRLSCQSVDKEEDGQESSGKDAGGQLHRGGRKRRTMKLSRDLSELVVFTNSVASQECLNEGTPGDVLSFSETRAQSLVNHRAEQFLAFNQRQLSRIYPSAYRIDSSNFNPQFYWNVGCQLVALNYQTEGRMMQLNRAKFMVNGGSGYVLKPPPMCKGSFNPFCDDPLPAYPKKQLILKIISGQQLPKPPDSMLGDRGEIIDPFVEVEIIGLPVDCCKEQTRVVDDNGFNPVWEENLSFTLHMAEVALVRFLVWDHDPIGRDFVGQRTVAFSSLMPGYRHVYLEGLTEASIFVHVSVHDIYGKGHQLRGIRGLFNRSSKSSVDTNSDTLRKRSISDHLLRRTASAPAKGRKKTKMALAESLASISDPKNSADTGTGGEGTVGKEGHVERRHLPQGPLTHRPVSMPLDRLLQSQLSLCSPDKEHHDMGADTVIGGVDHCDLKSPSSLHDSTISRLIDAVSLDNENDTCGSISALIGHPETTEQEEVYTILDEEVLSPTSVYNLKEQTIHLQAHSMESTPSNSLGSSPAKVPQGLGKQDTVGWDGFGEAEESIYEEVYDPIGPIPVNSRPSNPSPLRQNSYPIPQSKPESFDNDRDFSKSFTQQRSYHASKTSSPCKSKSLGDLTSEDISCNFQSKYHIISRSFITSHMMNRKRMGALGDVTFQSQSSDPLTEQLRKLVSLEGDDGDGGSSQSPQLSQVTKPLSQPQPTNTAPSAPRDIDDSPPLLTRRLSSRSQSRVRHINSRARERQQEALRPRAGMVIDDAASIGEIATILIMLFSLQTLPALPQSLRSTFY